MLVLLLLACSLDPALARPGPPEPAAGLVLPTPAPPPADGFDFPVGPDGYYDAQPFGRNLHLGEDWNGVGGGNTDLGDPVHVVAHGVVTLAEDVGGGWGNVVRVVHRYEEDGAWHEVESLYGHLDRVDVVTGQELHRGEVLGTIGTAHGVYIAHLHLELRSQVGLPLGPGYRADTSGYLAPTPFLREHRPR